MSTKSIAVFASFIPLLLAPAACAGPADTPPPGSDLIGTGEYSAAEKAAAGTLSMSNRQALGMVSDPYLKAVVCREATALLAKTVGERTASNPQIRATLNQVVAIYDKRVEKEARAGGHSPDTVAADRSRALTELVPSSTTKEQLGLGCLRELGQS